MGKRSRVAEGGKFGVFIPDSGSDRVRWICELSTMCVPGNLPSRAAGPAPLRHRKSRARVRSPSPPLQRPKLIAWGSIGSSRSPCERPLAHGFPINGGSVDASRTKLPLRGERMGQRSSLDSHPAPGTVDFKRPTSLVNCEKQTDNGQYQQSNIH
jgi:hypothetical protein